MTQDQLTERIIASVFKVDNALGPRQSRRFRKNMKCS